MQSVYALPLAALLLFLPSPAQTPVTSADFAARAYAALPAEPSYTFHRILSEGAPRVHRNPAARPGPDEMALPASGWTLLLPAEAGPALRQAAEDVREHLERDMQTRLALRTEARLAASQDLPHTIVAGTRDEMPGCGPELKARKDYRLVITPAHVTVCGYDERGAMYGLYHLEGRMDLREAPILPRNLDTTRHSLFQARMTLSGLGWEEWPDPYLALLPRYGFDSIYASVYVNPNGVPGPPPYWNRMKKQDPARVHDLIRRAARYGIDVYCPIVYLYTGEPDNEAGLRKLVRDIVTEFPEIRGYVLLTEGFFYRTFFGAGGQGKIDLRDWVRHWARGVEIVTEECRKINPAIEVLPWEYNIDFRPSMVELKAYGTAQLPLDSIPLLTFENGKSFERDGERGSLKDYAINEVGPAEVTAAQIAVAKKRGMRAVYSKADCWASWQYGTFPYLPFPYQWHARYQALEKYGVDGTMESWSYGFQPNYIAELRAWYSWSGAPPLDTLLRAIARREFGPGSEDLALRAWDHFSRAIRLVPDTGPNMGVNNAVATPLLFEKPEPRAMTVDHSWTDPAVWSHDSEITPYWPYTPRRLILLPDFTNRVNAAARYASPFSLPVFNKYLRLAADEMETGLAAYRRAALQAPPAKRNGAYREVLLAEQIQRMMRSDAAVLEFEDLRFRLEHASPAAEQRTLLDRMTALLKEELARTEDSYQTARRDSRLGYEWEQDYIYTPAHIQEKLHLLRATLNEQIPAWRRRHGL
ncbi:MAG TPA: hypothetical protein VFA33_22435 [Bryobacteraceae bacterium]|nr:hypothetical protein [Bryobacteraceae bacterium]